MDGDFLLTGSGTGQRELRFSFVGMKTKDVPYKKNQPALICRVRGRSGKYQGDRGNRDTSKSRNVT